MSSQQKLRKKIHDAQERRVALLSELVVAKKGYTELSGRDAIDRFLIDKYHWLPSDVRQLTLDDLDLLLAELL